MNVRKLAQCCQCTAFSRPSCYSNYLTDLKLSPGRMAEGLSPRGPQQMRLPCVSNEWPLQDHLPSRPIIST